MAPLLEALSIGKTYPGGTVANDGVNLSVEAGEVHAVVGENGAGKSTLVKILTGIYQPDGGEIVIDGQPTLLPGAQAATDAGIAAIHQETVLFDELTVAENIYIGHQPRTRFGLIDWAVMNRNAARVLDELEAKIDPTTRLRDLGIAQRHLVAIGRALSVHSRIVIMDEPTAALSHKEVEELYHVVERLKAGDRAILFISHKFEEVFRLADRYTVFRDGSVVGAGLMQDVQSADLVRMMVGRSVDQVFPKTEVAIGPTVMEVNGFSHPTEFDDISFDLHRGEILGIYGLVGAGRSEFAQALFGITRPSAGTVTIEGKPVTIRRPSDAIGAGLVYVPEERGRHGAVLPMSIAENIGMASLGRTSKGGFLDLARECQLARNYAERLELRASALNQPVATLSGGNQQKVVIGKWLATEPRIIVLDEPTKGIDIGSKAAVHAFMSELAGAGLSVIMISSELPEVLGMADRVLVMREGRMAGILGRADATPEKLVNLATGNETEAAA